MDSPAEKPQSTKPATLQLPSQRASLARRSSNTTGGRRCSLVAASIRGSFSQLDKRASVFIAKDGNERIWQPEGSSECAGPFYDYLERKKAQQRIAVKRSTIARCGENASTRGSFLDKTANMKLGLQDGGFAMFDTYLKQEQLEFDLNMCLLPLLRDRGDKAWAPVALKAFKEHVAFITQGKQLRLALGTEIIHYQLKHVVSFVKDSVSSEHYQMRNDRLKDFFKVYHASHSKVDLRMPSSKGKLRLVDSSPKDAQMAFSDSLSPTNVESRLPLEQPDPSQLPRIDAEGTPALPKVDSWKVRSCRGGKQRKGWDLPRQLSRLDEGSKGLGGSYSRPLTATLSGGWGLKDRRKGHERAQTAGELTRVGSPIDSPNSMVRVGSANSKGLVGTTKPMARVGSAPVFSSASKSLHRPTSAVPQGTLEPQQKKAFQRADLAFKGVVAASKLQRNLMRPTASAPPNVFAELRGESSTHPKAFAELRGESTAPPDLFAQLKGETSMTSPKAHPEVSEPAVESGTHLPRMERNPFISPWRKATDGTEHMSGADSPKAKYLRETELNRITPKLIPFVTGHSGGLIAPNQALTDCDLLAMGTMLNITGEMDVLDLSGNALLTEKSLVPFLNRLFEHPITNLSLKHCLRYALPPGIKECLDVVEQLLVAPNGLTRLKSLNIAGIQMGMRSQVKMCQAIQEHTCLADACLADTGIGGDLAKQCIQELMDSRTLTSLNLSWNSFTPEVFELLGERITQNTLKSLSIANCSSSQTGPDNPIAHFIEYLSHDKSLTHLDVSVNRITFRGTLVLEDALENNMSLKELTASNNPFGVLGMRSLLRVLARNTSGLLHFTSEGCAGGSPLEAVSEDMQIFSAVNPGGRYKLNLSRTYHRAMLRMLYKSCERFKLTPDMAFVDLSYSKGAYSHPSKDEFGVYLVPQQGRLTFTFSMERATEGVFKGISNRSDFQLYLTKYYQVMRLRPGIRKIVALMALWKSMEGRSLEQLVILLAISKDFSFTLPQMAVLCGSRQIITEILGNLLPLLEGGERSMYLATRLVTGIGEYVKLSRRTQILEQFNVQNPTGHYKLDLEEPMDFHIAESLVLLDRWETATARLLDRVDTSQRGNRSRFRNERFQEMPLPINSVAEWNMPEWEIFECDYVSGKRPPEKVKTLDHETFLGILLALQNSEFSPKMQVVVLNKVSHHMYVSSRQIRQMIGLYKDADVRVDLIVCMFMQVTDIINEKVFRVRFDSKAELDSIRHRLGQVCCFPFVQPEQMQFELDFSQYDNRLAVVNLLSLANKERMSNIQEVLFTLADGRVDELPLGVPRSWEYLDRVPHDGTFRCKYVCSPEDRKIQERKRLIETYGWWPGPNDVGDVNWWAALTEAPEDVIEFLYFVCARFENVYDAFVEIDGPDGNKNISLREFEEGLASMKCKKFNGRDKMQRIASIFRYLDPSGEGQVSEGEWGILEQLFKEILLCIAEFAQFLERTFEDLSAAWDFLDSDGSGAISFEEWEEAVESMGYFGPAKPIFSYLDKDNEGNIELEEFNELEKFLHDHESPASPH